MTIAVFAIHVDPVPAVAVATLQILGMLLLLAAFARWLSPSLCHPVVCARASRGCGGLFYPEC